MKLSDVKTDKDWEEYEYRKAMQTHERLKAEMGMGPNAYTLPAPYYEDAEYLPNLATYQEE